MSRPPVADDQSVSPRQFKQMARSSPWRWSTLRFTYRRNYPVGPRTVNVWVTRPGRIHVEELDGTVVFRNTKRSARSSGGDALLVRTDDGSSDRPGYLRTPAAHPAVGWSDAGWVTERPADLDHRDPSFGDLYLAAALDPVDLADLRDVSAPSTEVSGVTTIRIAGRAAVEATVRPTDAYAPDAGSADGLLWARANADEVEGTETRGATDRRELLAPDAFRVALDAETCVCVRSRAIGGSADGTGHEITIHSVDDQGDVIRDPTALERLTGLLRRRPTAR